MRMTARKSSARSVGPGKPGSSIFSGVRQVLGTANSEEAGARRKLTAQLVLGLAGVALITFTCFQLGLGLERTGFAYIILLTLLSPLGSSTASVFLSILATATTRRVGHWNASATEEG
jgi:hypothetical protein